MNISNLNQEDFNQLMNEAVLSPKKISRKILHSKNSEKMQCMLIAFAPNNYYDFIADNLEGNIIFCCIKGNMEINYFDQKINSIKKCSKLNSGDLLVIPRNYFRSTKVFQEGAVFLESIEGPYLKEKRIKFKQK